MLAPFPHHYSTSMCRSFASRTRSNAPPRFVLHGGPSPELGSDLAAWSPQHMLLSSLGLCLLNTFEAFAVRDRIELLDWRAKVSGVVDDTPEGPSFTSIVVELDVEIAGQVDRFEAALDEAKRYCLVHNALRVPVVVEAQIRTPGEPAVELADLGAQPPHDARPAARPQLRAV